MALHLPVQTPALARPPTCPNLVSSGFWHPHAASPKLPRVFYSPRSPQPPLIPSRWRLRFGRGLIAEQRAQLRRSIFLSTTPSLLFFFYIYIFKEYANAGYYWAAVV